MRSHLKSSLCYLIHTQFILVNREAIETKIKMTGETGQPGPLTPKDKDSFAYPTMKDRVPVIICKVVDLLYRDRVSLKLKDSNQLKNIIDEMSRLRYEMLTDKPLGFIKDNGVVRIFFMIYLFLTFCLPFF